MGAPYGSHQVPVPHLLLCTACGNILHHIFQVPMHFCLCLLFTAHQGSRHIKVSVCARVSHAAATHQPNQNSVVCFGKDLATQQYSFVVTIHGALRAGSWCPSFESNTAAVFILCSDARGGLLVAEVPLSVAAPSRQGPHALNRTGVEGAHPLPFWQNWA
jgi:hypothetical protein